MIDYLIELLAFLPATLALAIAWWLERQGRLAAEAALALTSRGELSPAVPPWGTRASRDYHAQRRDREAQLAQEAWQAIPPRGE